MQKTEQSGQGGLSKDQIQVCSLINNFGATLLSKITAHAEPGQNVFISPLSISEPLSALANGADEVAQQELLKVLRFDTLKDFTLVNNLFPTLNRFLTGTPDVEVAIANSLWLNPSYKVNPEVGSILSNSFDMQYYPLKSASEINAWVAKATRDKITKIFDSLQPAEKMVLINAVYFKGLFAEQFKESLTKEDVFHSTKGDKKIQMMEQKRKFMYAHTANYQAVKLEYKSQSSENSPHYESTVILPAEGKMQELVGLISKDFGLFNANFKKTEGTLFMPKFKLEYSIQIADTLKELGLINVFKPGHFPKLTEPNDLFIDSIIHKTFLEVNEKGAEAAAVTAVRMMRTAALPPETFTMKVDRPFIFAIQEKITGVVMFVGVIETIGS